MRNKVIAAISTCALLVACGPQAATAPSSQATSQHSQSAQQLAPDARFLSAAIIYETYQVQAAQIAQTNAQSQAVKTYAASAEAAHRETRQSLTALALQHGLPAPTDDLNEDYRAYIERLHADDPTPFDVRYISQQTLTTMSMAGRYDAFTSTAPDSPLKRWAAARSQVVHDDIQAAHHLAAATR